jgi:hypothetical protein
MRNGQKTPRGFSECPCGRSVTTVLLVETNITKEGEHAMNRAIVLSVSLLLATSAARAENYAVLFSGGYEAAQNDDRFNMETLRMWNIYTGVLGFSPNNIYVLSSDGTDPAPDLMSGNSSDWTAVTAAGGHVLAATSDNLHATLQDLGQVITGGDNFHFWSGDHGYNDTDPPGPATPDGGGLAAWNLQLVPDDVFASWVNPIDARSKLFVFTQCFAGDMVDDLNLGDNGFAAYAAAWNEESSFSTASNGSILDWANTWADGIGQGLDSTWALGDYAKKNDPYAPGGFLSGPDSTEHPGWAGANFSITTGQAVIPAPGAVLLALLGLGGIGGLRRKRVL